MVRNPILKKLILIYCCLVAVSSFSQDQHLIDSLQNTLKQLEGERTELRNGKLSLRDSSMANILIELSRTFMYNKPTSAMDFAKQSLAISEQIGWKKGASTAYRVIGVITYNEGNYPEAIKNQLLSVKISEEIGYKNGIARGYGNIGMVYGSLGNYTEALRKNYACLKILEELNDKPGIANSYNNLGNINSDLGNNTEALKNYSASLNIAEELGDKIQIAIALANLGDIYSTLGNYHEALKNFNKSIKINETIGNKRGISGTYINISGVYYKQKDYHEALKNLLASLEIMEEIGARQGISMCYSNIGEVYLKLNCARAGREWLQKGLKVAKQIGSKDLIASSLGGLAVADSALGNYKSALENYKLYTLYKDSLSNNENTKKITQQQMQYEFDKKEALSKADQEKKDAVALEEIENQKLVRNGFMGGFAGVLFFAGTFFRQRNKIKKEKKRSDQLLRNILPDEVAEELKETGGSKAKTHGMVSVMFTDFKDFTKISETVSAEMLVDELHTCFSAFDNILHKYNIEKIKTIGDAYMCVSGLPISSKSHATDVVNAAIEIMDYVKVRKTEKEAKGEFAFELRIGINSGPVVAGIVGLKKFSYDIWGDTVNTAARMENNGESGKINISGTTYEMIKDKFTCVHRGKITAKNKGEIDMYFIDRRLNSARLDQS
jgi:adenylate cyclase